MQVICSATFHTEGYHEVCYSPYLVADNLLGQDLWDGQTDKLKVKIHIFLPNAFIIELTVW